MVNNNFRAIAVIGQLLHVSGLLKIVEIDDLKTTFGRFGILTKVNIFKKKCHLVRQKYAIIRLENRELINEVAHLETILLENNNKVIVEKLKNKSLKHGSH